MHGMEKIMTDYSLDPNFKPEEYNQLFVTVKNTAFSRHDDHDVYTVKVHTSQMLIIRDYLTSMLLILSM